MPTLTERLEAKFFPRAGHPFEIYLSEIRSRIQPTDTLLDAGCGRTAEILSGLSSSVQRAVGVDLANFEPKTSGVHLVNSNLEKLALRSSSVNVIISRSVLEHVIDPQELFCEVSRVLKVNGHFIFLTPNLWDYASLCSKLVPNNWHPAIVRRCGGRPEHDTFPAYYRANTPGAIAGLARQSGLTVVGISHLGQYPYYLSFNPLALIGTAYEKLISRFDCMRLLRGWLLAVLIKGPNAGAPE